MSTLPPAYPGSWESDIVASDGRTVHVRPIRPDDRDAIRRLHARCSPETIYYRFFTPLPELSEEMLERFTVVDYEDRMAFVAEWGTELIAVARYDRLAGSAEAEVAFLVDDAHQGRGLGAALLELLAAYARQHGIARFVAETLPDNVRMLKVFQDAGYRVARSYADGTVHVEFPIEPTPSSVAAMAERERRAAAASVHALLRPHHVALVGASRTPGSVGDLLLANLLAGRFDGTIWAVNPNAESVRGVATVPNLRAIPQPVDLAIIALRREELPGTLEDAAAAGVRALVVVTAGFSEMSAEGAEEERRLVAGARRLGMRVVGPNSMGVATPALGLAGTLAPFALTPGPVAVHAQSGPLSLAILAKLAEASIGISSFVSSGNKADISGNDLLAWWETDETTRIIVLYIEDFGNPRTFARVARRISQTKPILVVKPERERRQRRGPEPIGELDEERAIDALLERTGVLRTQTLEELTELVRLLETQPLPAGDRVAVLANTQGPAPLAADALVRAGLRLAELGSATLQRLDDLGIRPARSTNPLELGPAVVPDDWEHALEALLGDEGVDAVLISFIPTVVGQPGDPRLLANPLPGGALRGVPTQGLARAAEVAEAVARAASQRSQREAKPVVANFLALPGVPEGLGAGARVVPSFDFPESAARALGHAARYAQWLARPSGAPLEAPLVDEEAIGDVLRSVAAPRTELASEEATRLLAALGIPTQPPKGGRREELDGRAVHLRIELLHLARYGPFLRLALSGEAFRRIGASTVQAVPHTTADVEEIIAAIPGAGLDDPEPAIPTAGLASILVALGALAERWFEVGALSLEPVIGTSPGWWVRSARCLLRPLALEPAMLTRSLRAPGSPSAAAEPRLSHASLQE
jgi:acyl-CoA synthetase (NDP forming)/RimJ/RimL family protein N-acetyltransferase